MNELNRLLAANIKKARNFLGYSQLKLAELCKLSPSYVGDIEIGKKYPSANTLQKIADILGLKPYQLFLDDADDPRWDKLREFSAIRRVLKERLTEDVDTIIDSQMKE